MPATATPEHIGHYAIDAELGRGAFGVVYRAHHLAHPNTHVALKVVEGRGNLDQLMLEPALLSQLDHPCIVGIEDYFRDGDRLVLVLEFVEGEDLKTLLDRGETFSQEQIRDLLVHVGSALATAHARNIVHRDIKPSNILLVRDASGSRFVLTDFGIGQRQEGIQDRKHTGGTYLFMAPEQLRGRPVPQSDLWALGVVAYRMLTGRMPFPGPSLPELAHQILYESPRPPSSVCDAGVDHELETTILRLLEKSLQERIGSTEELLRLLGYRGRPEDVLSRVVARKEKPAVAGTIERRLERTIRRKKLWLGLVLALYLLPSGLVCTACLLGGGWLFFKGQTETRWPRRKRAYILFAALALLAGYSVLRHFGSEWTLWQTVLFGKPSSAMVRLSGPTSWLDVKSGITPPQPPSNSPRPGQSAVDVRPEQSVSPAFVVLVTIFAVGLGLFLFLAPALAASIYVSLRRVKREKVLRDAALEGGTGSERYLDLFRDALDFRFADVGFHLKYAEALVARGRLAEAAVEARLILEQDPYNFGGNLLLANTYYSLGLFEECVAVCNSYLVVSGYCFEFAELQEQCRRRLGSA